MKEGVWVNTYLKGDGPPNYAPPLLYLIIFNKGDFLLHLHLSSAEFLEGEADMFLHKITLTKFLLLNCVGVSKAPWYNLFSVTY